MNQRIPAPDVFQDMRESLRDHLARRGGGVSRRGTPKPLAGVLL